VLVLVTRGQPAGMAVLAREFSTTLLMHTTAIDWLASTLLMTLARRPQIQHYATAETLPRWMRCFPCMQTTSVNQPECWFIASGERAERNIKLSRNGLVAKCR
jgi:hypothetical protein